MAESPQEMRKRVSMLSPFPDLPKLKQAMLLRGWMTPDLAREAGIAQSTAYRVLAGGGVTTPVIEAISKAIMDHPPQSATAAFLGEAAS